MLLKILLTVAVIGLVWMFLIRQAGARRIGDKKPVRVPRIETLGRCPACGVYRVYGGGCDCDQAPPPGPGERARPGRR